MKIQRRIDFSLICENEKKCIRVPVKMDVIYIDWKIPSPERTKETQCYFDFLFVLLTNLTFLLPSNISKRTVPYTFSIPSALHSVS